MCYSCTIKINQNKCMSQFHNHVQLLKMENSGGPLDNQTWHTDSWPQQKLPKFGVCTHTTSLWPMEQSSILSDKFDSPVAYQNFPLQLHNMHDSETTLLLKLCSFCFILIQNIHARNLNLGAPIVAGGAVKGSTHCSHLALPKHRPFHGCDLSLFQNSPLRRC